MRAANGVTDMRLRSMTAPPDNPFSNPATEAAFLHQDVNLHKRIVTGVILAPLFIATPWISPLLFQLILWIAAGLCLREWINMAVRQATHQDVAIGFVIAGFLGLITLLISPHVSFLLMGLIALFIQGVSRFTRHERLWLSLGLVYITTAVYALTILVENAVWGPNSVMFILAAVCAGDMGAYFVGKTLGGPRLWPEVSPKKTWSGFWGGLICSAIAGMIFSYWMHAEIIPFTIIVMVGVTLCGKAGDLLESWLKRQHKIKDSGTLLPGHGGLLDRVDGYLLAAPLFLLFLWALYPITPW